MYGIYIFLPVSMIFLSNCASEIELYEREGDESEGHGLEI